MSLALDPDSHRERQRRAREREKGAGEPLDPPWPYAPVPFDPRAFGVRPSAAPVDSGAGT